MKNVDTTGKDCLEMTSKTNSAEFNRLVDDLAAELVAEDVVPDLEATNRLELTILSQTAVMSQVSPEKQKVAAVKPHLINRLQSWLEAVSIGPTKVALPTLAVAAILVGALMFNAGLLSPSPDTVANLSSDADLTFQELWLAEDELLFAGEL